MGVAVNKCTTWGILSSGGLSDWKCL